MATCNTLEVLLSDLEQPKENSVTKTQAPIKKVFVNSFDILIMSFFVEVRIGKQSVYWCFYACSLESLDRETLTFFKIFHF